MLRINKTKIVDDKGRPITLKGVNLGGWLMMEAYILHAPNEAAQRFRKEFKKVNGAKGLEEFDRSFRAAWIREEDFGRIKSLGLNCVRVPFNYRLIEGAPYQYSKKGVGYLDKVISWAKKYKLYVILDLHAAPGSQNHDWHSDSLGKADLWEKTSCQKRMFSLWEYLADRYKDEEIVAGYDILNEAVVHDAEKLNKLYEGIIKGIRSVDRNHILFVEGNMWATNLECLDLFHDDNLALSVHTYEPLAFTFNFVPQISYPLYSPQGTYDKSAIRQLMMKYKRISEKRGRPILDGEFGINCRQGVYGEDVWLEDTLECLEECGFHWTYWTFKAIKNGVFPDGVFSYIGNPPWVHREGPRQGWQTYPLLWKECKQEMITSWDTKNFRENKTITKILKNAAR